jgi:protein-S-isoprenylcysteine O-methyltransferase Ste14
MLLSLWGAALIAPSVSTITLWLCAAVIISLQVRMEERHLLALHGWTYGRYAARVGRFVPWLGRF